MKRLLQQPRIVLICVLLLGLFVLPWLEPGGITGDLLSEELHGKLKEVGVLIMIYMILALGLNIVVGFVGLLDLGYVAFMTVGAYTSVLLYREPSWHFYGSFFVVLLIAGAHCALWALIRGAPTLHLTGDYYAIVTLAFAEIIFLIILNESWLTGGPSGIKEYPPVTMAYAPGATREIEVDVRIDSDGLPGEIVYRPDSLWFGEPSSQASDSIKNRYQSMKRPDPDESGSRIRLRNWDDETLFLKLRSDQPWLLTSNGIVGGLSPGSVSHIHPDDQEPGTFKKPVIFPDTSRLAPGEHHATLTVSSHFARCVLKNGSAGFHWLVFSILIVILFVCWRLRHSRLGRAWISIKVDELSSKSCGINLHRKKLIAFAVSGFIGGVGGTLMAYKNLIVSTNIFEFWLSIVVLCCVVLGGMGSLPGVLTGAFLFVGLGELLREPVMISNVGESFRQWVENGPTLIQQVFQLRQDGVEINLSRTRYLFFGLLLVLLMIFKPAGLFPPSGETPPADGDALRDSARMTDLYHLGAIGSSKSGKST